MPGNVLTATIKVDTQGVKQAFEGVSDQSVATKNALEILGNQLIRLQKIASQDLNFRQLERVNQLINQTQSSLKKLQAASTIKPIGFDDFTQKTKSLAAGTNAANVALINTGRIFQDLPFGIIGIANNINPLIESFQRLKTEAGTTGGVFAALKAGLAGGGGLGLAFSLITSAAQFAVVGLSAFSRGIGQSKEGLDEASLAAEHFTFELNNIKQGIDELKANIDFLNKIGKINIDINFGKGFKADLLDLRGQSVLNRDLVAQLEKDVERARKIRQQIQSEFLSSSDAALNTSIKFPSLDLIPDDAIENLSKKEKTLLQKFKSTNDEIVKLDKSLNDARNEQRIKYREIEDAKVNDQRDTSKKLLDAQKKELEEQEKLLAERLKIFRENNFRFPEIRLPQTPEFNKLIEGAQGLSKEIKKQFDLLDSSDLNKFAAGIANISSLIKSFRSKIESANKIQPFSFDFSKLPKDLDLANDVLKRGLDELFKVRDEAFKLEKAKEPIDPFFGKLLLLKDSLSKPFRDALEDQLSSGIRGLQTANLQAQLQEKLKFFNESRVDTTQIKLKTALSFDPNIIIPAGIRKETQDKLHSIFPTGTPLVFEDIVVDGKVVVKAKVDIKEVTRQLNQQIADTVRDLQVNIATSVGEAIGNAISGVGTAKDAFKAVFDFLGEGIKAIGVALIKIGALSEGIQKALASLSIQPELAITLGIAFVALSQVLKNSFNPREKGGPVTKGQIYQVNERGQELFQPTAGKPFLITGGRQLFTPPTSGKIISHHETKKILSNFSSIKSSAKKVVNNISSSVRNIAGHRAGGGSVVGGNSYIVNERGAEIFLPNTGQSIKVHTARGSVSSGTMRVEVFGQFVQSGKDMIATIANAGRSQGRLA